MKKKLAILLALTALLAALPAFRTAAEASDADKLRAFLAQSENGQTNAEMLGWDIADTATWIGTASQTVWAGEKLKELSLAPFVNFLCGALDLSGCDALEKLLCSANNLTSINVAGCTALQDLQCSSNRLVSLDVTGCAALEILYCHENRLAALDVSGCGSLKTLGFSNNLLTQADVTGCARLQNLYCHNNFLAALDVSRCPLLKTLECHHNNITALDVSECPDLIKAMAYKNPLADADAFAASLPAGIEECAYSQGQDTFHTLKNAGKIITVQSTGGGYAYSSLVAKKLEVRLYPDKEEGYTFQRWESPIGLTEPDDSSAKYGLYISTLLADNAFIKAVYTGEGLPPSATPPGPHTPPPSDVLPMPGDANCDGKVDIEDILFCRDVIFGQRELSPQGLGNLRSDNDAQISIATIMFIRDIIFGEEV